MKVLERRHDFRGVEEDVGGGQAVRQPHEGEELAARQEGEEEVEVRPVPPAGGQRHDEGVPHLEQYLPLPDEVLRLPALHSSRYRDHLESVVGGRGPVEGEVDAGERSCRADNFTINSGSPLLCVSYLYSGCLSTPAGGSLSQLIWCGLPASGRTLGCQEQVAVRGALSKVCILYTGKEIAVTKRDDISSPLYFLPDGRVCNVYCRAAERNVEECCRSREISPV